MKTVHDVIQEDVNAAIRVLEDEDFELMNILANRITSNAYLSNEKKYVLPGVLLKEVAFDFIDALRRKRDTTEAKPIGKRFSDELKENLATPDIDGTKLWRNYLQYSNEVRKVLRTEIEDDVYTDNLEFVNTTFAVLANMLHDSEIAFGKEILELLDNVEIIRT